MQKNLKKYFAVFALPTLIAFTIAFIVPFLMGLYLSMCKFNTIENTTFVGFDNYIKAITDKNFGTAFVFTALFTIVSVITINLFAFALAMILTRAFKGTNLFRTVFFMPNLIGGIVLGYIWQIIINGVLLNFGVDITYDAKYGFWGLVILMNWQLIGYMMVIYIAGLQNIPSELVEASKIDGASPWQALRNVTIPMVMSSITICMFLTLTNSFKLFHPAFALTGGAPERQTATLALDIFDTFYGRNGWKGVGQAKAVIFFLLVAGIAFIQLRLTRSKEVES